LFILNVGIGLESCEPVCICDVDASGGAPSATDALICLQAAVGVPDLLSCNCAEPPCPTAAACSEMELRLLAGSELDVGWNGDGHDSPLAEGSTINFRVVRRCASSGAVCEVDADCTGSDSCEPTCRCDGNDAAPCEVAGPVAGQKRCNGYTGVTCESDDDCGAAQCKTFLGPPVPLAVAGLPLCVTTYVDDDVSGFVDPSLGTVELSALVRSRPSLGISSSQPCPYCGPPAEMPVIGDTFTCDGGPRNGETCIVGAVSPLFGGTSLDCLPHPQLATGFEYSLRLSEITTGQRTLDATIPCGGSLAGLHPDNGGAICLDTFTPCTSNDDCRRCTGLPTQACETNEDCSGVGACAAAPDQPIACGIYCHCGFCDADPASPCNADADCLPGQRCVQGSGLNQQIQNNDCRSLACGAEAHEACCSEESPTCANPTEAIGRCADAPYRPCEANEDCAVGGAVECALRDRPCFEGRIERSGTESPLGLHCIDDPEPGSCTTNADCGSGACVTDTATPTAVALFCVPATPSASVNASAGLAGPATLTLKTAVRVYRCGDRTLDGTEECDDGNAVNGDGCDEICRVER